MRHSRSTAAVLGAAVLTSVLTGCAGSQDGAAKDVARDFYRAVSESDGRHACALLSSRTRAEVRKSSKSPCDQGLLDENLPNVVEPSAVRVYGVMAQAQFRDETGARVETTFLSRYADGWHVTAAGCTTTERTAPHDCQVSGG